MDFKYYVVLDQNERISFIGGFSYKPKVSSDYSVLEVTENTFNQLLELRGFRVYSGK